MDVVCTNLASKSVRISLAGQSVYFFASKCLFELFNGVCDFASKCRPLMFDFASKVIQGSV